MDAAEKETRQLIVDNLALAGVDTSNLAIELVDGDVAVRGTLPSQDHNHRLRRVLASMHQLLAVRYDIAIRTDRGAPADRATPPSPELHG